MHLLQHFRIYLLTPRSRVLLEKLTGFQLVKKFPTFHGTRRFITALTSVRLQALSWARSIKLLPPRPTSWRSILIVYSHLHLGLPSDRFVQGFLPKFGVPLADAIYISRPSNPPITLLSRAVRIAQLFIMRFFHSPVTSSHWIPNFLHQNPVLRHPPCASYTWERCVTHRYEKTGK